MRRFDLKTGLLLAAALLTLPHVEAQLAVKPAHHTCTDLSGNPLPCPGEQAVVSSSAQEAPTKAKLDSGSGTTTVEPQTRGSSEPVFRPQSSLARSLPKDILEGQKDFWTMPVRFRLSDVSWGVPFAIVTGTLIASDTSIEKKLPSSASTIKRFDNLSNYGAFAMGGMVGGTYILGRMKHNQYLSDTAWLAGEAGANSFITSYALKSVIGRQRPDEGNGKGDFFSGGQSFPSEHAAAAWSVATVFADRYPSPLTKFLMYGGAATITASRVIAQKHFASDVFIGTALGWYFGHQAVRRYDREHAPDAIYGTFVRSKEAPELHGDDMASPYVPLDSWIYPVMDRLAGLGVIPAAALGQRPWTRLECARLISNAAGERDMGDGSQASILLGSLQSEFAWDEAQLENQSNVGLHVDSLYTRFTNISGTPVNDSYHFGQTIINDFGRPYQQGLNVISGFQASANAGRLTFFVSGEYQHAPSAPAYSDTARQVIANADVNPIQPATPFNAANRFDLLDSYAAFAFHDNQISFGKQSLWWGPDRGGSLLFSDNAEPIEMLRFSRVSPVKLKFLGPMYYDFFFGKLDGHNFPPNPWMWGEKVSFKPTPNLELGFSRTAVFAGEGITPLTWGNFFRSYTSVSSQNKGTRIDPGKRDGGFTFSYRLPWLRNWATIYAEGLSADDPSPLAAPRRAAWNPGIYFSHLPMIPKMDLRLEAVYTDVPTGRSIDGRFIYWDFIYHDSYVNDRYLMGDWIGREGTGFQAWTTYWFSPRTQLQFAYRNARVANDFIPNGETLHDASVTLQAPVMKDVFLSTTVQYEHLNAPVLNLFQSSNVTTSVGLNFMPTRKAN